MEPFYDTATERIWSYIPEYLRNADASTNWTLKKLIACVGVQIGDIEDILQRIDYIPLDDGGDPADTSALVDPRTADLAWLPWIGQLLGIRDASASDSSREAILGAASGYQGGTADAIKAAVKSVLVGEKYVDLYNRSTSAGPGTGGIWDLLIVTRASETLINLVPKWLAAGSVSNGYNYTGAEWDVKNSVEREDFYNAKAVEFTIKDLAPGETINIQMAVAFTAYAGDPLNFMYGFATQSTGNRAWTCQLDFYNGGSFLSSQTEVESQSNTFNKSQFVTSVTAPASTTLCRAQWKFAYADGWRTGDKIYLGELGARRESDTSWIPETANPIAAVIEKGAKPAGVKLWTGTFSTTWQEWTNAGIDTWVPDFDGHTWGELEEV